MFKSLPPLLAAGRRHLAALWLTVVAGAFVSGYLFAAGALHGGSAPGAPGVTASGTPARGSVPGVPEPAITRHPAMVTRSGTAAFAYADGDRSTRFACSLDGAPFAPCPRGGITYRGLRAGGHAFAVVAVAGGLRSRAVHYSWLVSWLARRRG